MKGSLQICLAYHGIFSPWEAIPAVLTWKCFTKMQDHQYFRLDLYHIMRHLPESLRLSYILWKISSRDRCEKHREFKHAHTRIAFTGGIMGNRRCALIERTGVPLTKAIKCSRRLADWSSQACSSTKSASNLKPVYLHPQNKRVSERKTKSHTLKYFLAVILSYSGNTLPPHPFIPNSHYSAWWLLNQFGIS